MKNSSDLLDEIVFEHRNKLYGAYFMRKKYKKTLVLVLFFFVFLQIILSACFFLYSNKADEDISEFKFNSEYFPLTSPEDKLPPEEILPAELIKMQKKIRFVAPVVSDEIDSESENIPEEFLNEGDTTIDGTSSNGSTTGVIEGVGNNDNEVYTYVEEQPHFPGGEKYRIKFLQRNIMYPLFARQNNIQGIVYTSFIVEKDGSISSVKVLQGIGAGCDEEAVRVVKLMPRWTPGKRQGVAVRVVMTMPIHFILQTKS